MQNIKIEKQEESNPETLILNVDAKSGTTYNKLTQFELDRIVENVQNNLNLSTDSAIAAVTYDDEKNIDLLARLVQSEVGNLNDEAQIATASVVMNRVISNKYPNSIYDVIYQNGQYSVVRSGRINCCPSDRAYENAKYVYENGSQIPKNVVYQSMSKQGSGVWKEISGEYFCYQ